MSRDFYELCYDQYKQEMAEADGLYQKAGFMLVLIPLLGSAMVTLGRIDLLAQMFTRVDTFFFHLAFAVAAVALVVSTVFVFLFVCPRSRYKTLASMDVWQQWRQDYQEYLKKQKENGSDGEAIDLAMFENITPRLAEAQPINAALNEKRRKHFQRSVKAAAVALAAVGMEALFHLILNAQGV
ncbi:MAG TPA: hypothetical protein PKG77_16260 [Phycisphaerae bacterium]|nr:hypothetical protein [Phycisphaerae bacterium]HQL75123.1 hypothetical protein [Phycisphaerae bacterium]